MTYTCDELADTLYIRALPVNKRDIGPYALMTQVATADQSRNLAEASQTRSSDSAQS